MFPLSTQKFRACEIVPGFIAHVNPNAFEYVRNLREKSTRFGPLYGFQNTHLHFSFLSERLAEALFSHNWTQYISEMDQDIAALDSALTKSAERGKLVRLPKKRRVV